MTGGNAESAGAMTLDAALAWVADVLDEKISHVRPDTPRSNLVGWDSLGQLVLMSALDQQFGIKLTQEELGSLTSVQDILDVLRRHGRLAAS